MSLTTNKQNNPKMSVSGCIKYISEFNMKNIITDRINIANGTSVTTGINKSPMNILIMMRSIEATAI